MTTTLTTIPVWPAGVPGALGQADADTPDITIFLPPAELATGAAVLICPGGGYGGLATDHEGHQIAAWLNARGVAGFMLRYRVAPYKHPIPLMDAARALRIVRSGAAAWGVQPDRIGIWGFSAGGHLVSTLATHFTPGDAGAADPIERVSSRPDFLILGYPVITMDESFTHMGSRLNLLGSNADPALVELLSNEKQVTADTPPTFIFHTTDDQAVPVENSVVFYLACRKAGVPVEMHCYASGPHGVGLKLDDPVLGTWPARLEDWLRGLGVV